MDPKLSVVVEQSLLPVQNPPSYTNVGFPPTVSYHSTSGQPVQQYGAPAASFQCTQGPSPVQTVVNMQSTVTSVNPQVMPESDYLYYSIFTLLCCFLPLGVAALVYSFTTRDAKMFGHQPIASKNSRMARTLNNISLAIGLFIWLSGIITCIAIAQTVAQYSINRFG